jgi:hypothetical protein
MQRTINGPEKEWLSARECCKYLSVGPKGFAHLQKHGFPPPVEIAPNVQRWNWMDVVAYMHLKQRGASF